MATSRPGFARKDTEGIPFSDMPSSSKSQGYEFQDRGAKDGTNVGITEEGSDDKKYDDIGNELPNYADDEEGHFTKPVETAQDLTTQVLHVDDDPSLSPYTFRVFFLGTGLSIFGSVLQEIFYFKPQTIFVSVVFLTVIAYVLGEFMAFAIPSKGFFRHLNPGPFNQKEHAAIAIMASAAAQTATSTEALAAQQLFYGGYPSKTAGIFVTLSSQLIGFGIAGLLRDVLIYPTKMLWPITLPTATLLETLHRDKHETKRRLKVFYIVFGLIFVWEVLPEYMFTVLTGVSVFCLAKQDNLVFTNLFGGASGNEGLGFLSVCFDWNYIAGLWSPLWYPWQSTVNQGLGLIGCYCLFMGVYYSNTWRSQDFPFLSQFLYNGTSNSTNYVVYNQTLILNDQLEIDQAKLAGETTFTHMLLWNWDDIKTGWTWASPANMKRLFSGTGGKFWQKTESTEDRMARKLADPAIDPHYKLMLRNGYEETPMWWWGAVLAASFVVGLVCLYVMKSTLPWWGFVVATLLTTVFMLFFGAQMGITGFQFNIQPICQMLAGYMFPGRPLANFYFTCYTYNALQQGQLLAKDIKLAQYVHLPPKCTFMVQVGGAAIGALFNWVQIVQNQAPLLLDIQGSNIWSGQNIQQFNTLAIAWSMAKDMFSVGARYQWVTLAFLIGFLVPLPFYIGHKLTGWRGFSYINCSIILWFMGNLFVGINSSILMFFVIAAFSQFYLRKYKPDLFIKYNYIVAAALDGGTQVLVFILTFAVAGGSGKAVPFPTWAGNPDSDLHNIDYCMVNPANDG
ncbi:hypothetical protein B0A48_03393 [Cryoendolithus antarcticus]|uniref:OPT family small oligopeptide transporter n=1 Tax=Cryoendolithus antarcticus TaxID=1507870 RepID=A0A1V8TJW3_9PEZI|nr:hypothetical protein B0A48_03393 [Cryoendolithus antarcticus]